MKQKNIIAGNWKMNLGPEAAASLAGEIRSISEALSKTEVWIAPPAVSISPAVKATRGSAVKVGAQNVHWEESGAFTGEVSVSMLIEAGAEFAIVGHSERRHIFGETNEMTARRAAAALGKGFTTVFCIGETLAERESGRTNHVLAQQLDALIAALATGGEGLVLAYEPVWAIGTGKVASATEIENAHTFIQSHWSERCGSQSPRILYGGSVTPDNFAGIITISAVGGALVGGASLKADKFGELIRISEQS